MNELTGVWHQLKANRYQKMAEIQAKMLKLTDLPPDIAASLDYRGRKISNSNLTVDDLEI